MRKLEVNDYTCGVLRSKDIRTDIPFTEQFAKADTIQRANAVIAAYTNANYNELQNYNTAVEEISSKVDDLEDDVESKQDKLTAGSNITITEENVISATDTTYTAGSNIQISNENVISATDTTYTAGTGIEIENGIIRATGGSATWGDITGEITLQEDLMYELDKKQDVLTAGSNIQIAADGKTISATNTTYSAGSGISISDNNEISLNATIPSVLTTHSDSNNDTYACNYINGDTLYEDSGTGVNTDITLSANASLYKYFDIYYHNNDNVYGIARVPYTVNNAFIATFAATSTDIVVKTATISFSGTTLQRVYTREKGMNSTGQTNANNYIYIDKVIGFK